jgi:hypothetical protein
VIAAAAAIGTVATVTAGIAAAVATKTLRIYQKHGPAIPRRAFSFQSRISSQLSTGKHFEHSSLGPTMPRSTSARRISILFSLEVYRLSASSYAAVK